jgi:hypothetical protein
VAEYFDQPPGSIKDNEMELFALLHYMTFIEVPLQNSCETSVNQSNIEV